jgi:chromosome segregation ATPase
MAARKTTRPKTTSPEARAFVVVLEEIRAQNKVFGEGQQLLREQMSAGFEEVNRRFEQVDLRFEQVDLRFEQVDRRFERVEHDIAEIRQDIAEIRQDVVDIRQDITEIRQDVVDIRQDITEIRQDVGLVKIAVLDHSRELKEVRVALDKKVDRDEVEGIAQRVVARGR